MNYSVAIIYASFFGLIGFAVYFTNSAAPLWALLLMPSFKSKKVNRNDHT